MANIKWNTALTTTLIGLMEERELLYNVHHVDYTNKIKRIKAQQEIANRLNYEFPDVKVTFTPKIIMEKWSALRGQYKSEEKKVSYLQIRQ